MDELYVVRFGPPDAEPSSAGNGNDVEDQDVDERATFAHFGLAYYYACVLEHEIVNILAMTRIVAARRDAEALLSDPWSDGFKSTMGVLRRQIDAHVQDDPGLAADLIEAVRRRNHLAHAFWREHAEDILHLEGRARMVTELLEATILFRSVDERLTATIGTVAAQQWGVTAEVVDAWYQDTLGQVERGELNVPRATV